jgi:NADPH-dependent ferric siderophore reductase
VINEDLAGAASDIRLCPPRLRRADLTDARSIRREPPPFRKMQVDAIDTFNPHMVRVTFAGPELEGLHVDEPAASVRLLIPSPGAGGLVIPTWNGNEFLLPGGARPIIRTFTPRRADSEAGELDLDIVLHEGGAISTWVSGAEPGAEAAVSGPGRGYTIDPTAVSYLLAGDQTAIPAIGQLLEVLPATTSVRVIVEVAHPDARLDLPRHPGLTPVWVDLAEEEPPGTALLRAIRSSSVEPGTKVWVAGEAAGLHRIRKHLFEEQGLARSDVTARGYWKHGR